MFPHRNQQLLPHMSVMMMIFQFHFQSNILFRGNILPIQSLIDAVRQKYLSFSKRDFSKADEAASDWSRKKKNTL